MKRFRIGIAAISLLLLCGWTQGCKKACDDLADVCASCSNDDQSSCDWEYEICDMIKGKAGGDCCEAVLDDWKETCR